MKKLLFWLFFLYCVATVLFFFFGERFAFQTFPPRYDKSAAGLQILKTSNDKNLATRYWKSNVSGKLVLYFHGNAEDLGDLDFIAWYLNGKGLSLLSMDYRGYGLSTGAASEPNVYYDSKLLLKLANELGYSNNNIILWGSSIGSGPAVKLAATQDRDFAGLVLVSPFKSLATVLTQYPVIALDRFNNMSRIEDINEPLLLIHGIDDKIIPHQHSIELKNSYKGTADLKLIEGAGHNDLWLDKFDTVKAHFNQFFDNL